MNIATRKITGRTSDATIWSYLYSSEVKIITTNGEHHWHTSGHDVAGLRPSSWSSLPTADEEQLSHRRREQSCYLGAWEYQRACTFPGSQPSSQQAAEYRCILVSTGMHQRDDGSDALDSSSGESVIDVALWFTSEITQCLEASRQRSTAVYL